MRRNWKALNWLTGGYCFRRSAEEAVASNDVTEIQWRHQHPLLPPPLLLLLLLPPLLLSTYFWMLWATWIAATCHQMAADVDSITLPVIPANRLNHARIISRFNNGYCRRPRPRQRRRPISSFRWRRKSIAHFRRWRPYRPAARVSSRSCSNRIQPSYTNWKIVPNRFIPTRQKCKRPPKVALVTTPPLSGIRSRGRWTRRPKTPPSSWGFIIHPKNIKQQQQ